MKIVLFTKKEWGFADLSTYSANNIIQLSGSLSSLSGVVKQRPDIVLIGGFEASDALLNSVKVFCDALPQSFVAIHIPSPKSNFLMHAMHAGVREVFNSNTSEEIIEVIARADSHLGIGSNENSVRKAQTIGFISAKGGDGSTCMLANVAAALANDEGTRVIVVDLTLLYGDIEFYLTNKTIANNLAHFSTAFNRIDATLLKLMTHHVKENLHLIPSPPILEDVLKVKVDDVEKFVDSLSEHYDFILLDTDIGLSPLPIRILDKLDKLIVVSTLTISSARRASQILHLYEGMGFSAENAHILISHTGDPFDLSIDDYEKAVGKRIWRNIHREFKDIQESVLKGIPIIDLKPNSKFTRSILELASEWNGKPIKRKSSLWTFFGIK